ncbi:MAG: hypothetical protein NVS3B26_22940 [Mycobacteriales bacterium]
MGLYFRKSIGLGPFRLTLGAVAAPALDEAEIGPVDAGQVHEDCDGRVEPSVRRAVGGHAPDGTA